ncbi:MAG: polymerase III subunit gamma and tau protein [Candidatus Woesebacteria bacterium GW2011_GWA1_33_30]|uniref:DNA polymerase III subunit gamma/tau n=1 Tax=Candidatus Woesebacteria bacterium GW2011_GWA2_33_28 TaxID=1618561 RepID=A0A0G0C9W9_9BACT|nr:MAG: polymerase III subunit gamma and tau protein [Candidatus Woesebacteria bacterium GW2011_GWA2_33_28]KKP48793.1 MAG: polymerase III subunit gamma and tau protein [Candidatus Woesebacteria bacterium GW2011_GWA1_33_30]KKP50066.1 MAG: polymerase III subunit gamma and tau protein [Microgenomates group bacterium GW2011_GWC1_33_32]KKP51837.1 MAG: polymerase III subunit gamma and tau protein [Candidatus Woesebacteria bacterium GW2011_GWB1_33_38]KKP57837.1 MAG: polymerase III subunit gamma and ta
MTYYLKYRPQTIEELDMQSVRESLTNIVKSGNIPHAFLFAGPKGTGKTSVARILAKIINCESKNPPCNKCEQCLSITNGNNIDIIEMDAASNRGIDDIRALKDTIRLTPSKAKAKIYILDEAHMLTIEASNALLKTLEEPPSHVYFILATTNPEKLIETVKSRTVLISFTKATPEETKRSLARIIKKEELKIKNEELNEIIKMSKGSFRDAVKLLEQFSKDSNFLKSIKLFDVQDFLEVLLAKNLKEAIIKIENALRSGCTIVNTTEEILEKLQSKLIETEDRNLVTLIEYILEAQEFNKVTPIEELPLEVAIVKWCKLDK